MKICKHQDKSLKEDHIDIYYAQITPQISGLFEYLDAMHTIAGKNQSAQRMIHVSEIFYCEIVDRKCYAYLEQEVYEIDFSLQKLLDTYHSNGLVRISRSMCVNVLKIQQIKTDFNMKLQLQLKNNEVVILNRNYKNEFYKYVKQLTGGQGA